jgi:hypothetical protein
MLSSRSALHYTNTDSVFYASVTIRHMNGVALSPACQNSDTLVSDPLQKWICWKAEYAFHSLRLKNFRYRVPTLHAHFPFKRKLPP